MQKAFKYILTVTVIMFTLLASVLQFHHHDCDGHIYLSLSTATEIALGDYDDAIHECNHSHSRPHKCNGGTRCSMHISYQEIRKAINIPKTPLLTIGAIYEVIGDTLISKTCASPNTDRNYLDIFKYVLKNLIYSSSIFRDPPLWYLCDSCNPIATLNY